MNITSEIRRWIVIGLIATVLVIAVSFLTMCQRGKTLKAENQTANATGKALDTVTRETETARTEQVEKQNEVEKIEGADQRLPDNFGRDLERVRRGD